jgi:glycosyltransferase involved in cell wall biosynthesis
MKVLIAHNRYQQRGGEDAVAEGELALLQDSGIEAAGHFVDNGEIGGVAARLRALTQVRDNSAQAEALIRHAREFGADVVHIHNFFPLLSPGAHLGLHAAGFPVVQTLHNYRLLCANGLFLRQERVCEDCLTRGRHSALVHRCYRDSMAGSLAVLAVQNATIRDAGWREAVSRWIALTDFQRRKMVDAGLPADRVEVKGNSVADPGAGAAPAARAGALFVGRIASGKGVDVLLRAWRDVAGVPLIIVGDGPLLEPLRAEAPAGVVFAGAQPREAVIALMKQARFLLLPSTCYEGFPMTLVEAFSTGLPVIASRIGGIPELVEEGRQGFLAPPGDAAALAATVRQAFALSLDAYARMSGGARYAFDNRHSPQHNLAELLAIYGRAICLNASGGERAPLGPEPVG